MQPEARRQLDLDFSIQRDNQGYSAWIEQRRAAIGQLAKTMGLPIGRNVEVWLRDGVRLRGILQLDEEPLFIAEERGFKIQFRIDGVKFAAAEIESCVRLD